jgi:hypothetical protein
MSWGLKEKETKIERDFKMTGIFMTSKATLLQ